MLVNIFKNGKKNLNTERFREYNTMDSFLNCVSETRLNMKQILQTWKKLSFPPFLLKINVIKEALSTN